MRLHPIRFGLLALVVAVLFVSVPSAAQAGRLLQRWMEARIERNKIHKGTEMSSGADVLVKGDTVLWNVAYGTEERQKMDVYAPLNARNAPVIIQVHGGGWISGDKAHEPVVQNKGKHFLDKGFVFISMNYRLVPSVTPAEQVRDLAAAMKFVQENAASWGGDPSRIVLMGHSAGGHLVSLLAANPASPILAGVKPWRATITLDSAAVDVERLMAAGAGGFYQQAFGQNRDFWVSVSPYHQLAAKARPFLLICSLNRGEDSCGPVQSFVDKATKLGVIAEAMPVELGHGDITIQLGLESPYTAAVDAFIAKVIK